MTQEQVWKTLHDNLQGITDSLGTPIDEGIKETVVALSVHDFLTLASCEGHLERGCCYPWVDVLLPTPKEEGEKIKKFLENLLLEHSLYSDSGDARIVTVEFEPRKDGSVPVRLQSEGSLLLSRLPKEILTPQIKKKILERYQKEMDSFTNFLKEKFFPKRK